MKREDGSQGLTGAAAGAQPNSLLGLLNTWFCTRNSLGGRLAKHNLFWAVTE
jgi:hypothetical protein